MMRRLVCLVGMTLLAAGCSTGSAGPATVSLDEFSIEAVGDLGDGPIEVRNTGEFGHTLLVSTSGDEVLAGTEVIPPGGTATLDVDLGAGTYQLTCRIVVEVPDGRIVDHYAEGMDLSVLVG